MSKFYVYFLRRPDRKDPLWPDEFQPFYIGKGSNGRINEHRKEAKRYQNGDLNFKSPKNSIIVSLWKKGLDFKKEIILSDLTEEEAFEYEKQAISIYGRKDNKTGILANMTDGGDGNTGYNHTEEAKRKIGDSCKGDKHHWFGHKMPQEVKEKIGEANKGKWLGRHHTEETKEKLRLIRSGKNNPMYGKTLTKEHKEKLSKAFKGRVAPNKGKTISEEAKLKMGKRSKKWWDTLSPEDYEKRCIKVRGENNPMYGKKLTESHKRKLREAWVRRKLRNI